MNAETKVLLDVLTGDPARFQGDWLAEVGSSGTAGAASSTAAHDVRELHEALVEALRMDPRLDAFEAAPFQRLRGVLASLSASRAAQGASAGETSQFVMALKRPLFVGLRNAAALGVDERFDANWAASLLVDRMAQDEHYAKVRELLRKIAAKENVMIVRRYEAQRLLTQAEGSGGGLIPDEFQRSEAGYACLSQYMARAITLGIFGQRLRVRPLAVPPQQQPQN